MQSLHSPETRIEAANVLYTISSGSQDALEQLLKLNVLDALLPVISTIDPSSPHRLKVAVGRALRALVGSLADCCGLHIWGILPSTSPDLRKRAQFALEEFYQPTALDIWLPHLDDPSLHVYICGTISVGVRTPAHRYALCKWKPLAERSKSKGKRGWEKTSTSITSPTSLSLITTLTWTTPGFSWLVRHLASAVFEPGISEASIISSLDALSSLCKDNSSVSVNLWIESSPVTATHGDPMSLRLRSFLQLLRSPSPDIQIAAVHLLATVCRANLGQQTTGHHRSFGTVGPLDQRPYHAVCSTVIHTLNGIIGATDEAIAIRTKACFILSRLVLDDKAITDVAVDAGALQALLTALEPEPEAPTVQNTEEMQVNVEEEIEELPQDLHFREAAFTCLSSVGLTDSQYSRQILEMDAKREASPAPSSRRSTQSSKEPFLFPLLSKSIAHFHLGVRYSALQLVRALSRALAVLRTGIVDTDIPTKVTGVISKESEHRAVLIAALMVTCNLVNDYAPFREDLIKGGVVHHLVRHTHSTDDDVRLNALWAIKNALYNAKTSEIAEVINILTWDHLIKLSEDADRRVREQAVVVLQNTTTSDADIAYTVSMLGEQRLSKVLHQSLSNNDPKTVEHAIRAMNNIATGTLSHRELIFTNKPLLTLLRNALAHSSVGVRCAAATCICELLAAQPFRHRELREVGIEQALRSVLGVRERSNIFAHPHSHSIHPLPAIHPQAVASAPSSSMSHSPLSTGSGFGAALGTTGSFGQVGSGHVGLMESVPESPGLMGRETDREVIEAVKVALALLDKGKE